MKGKFNFFILSLCFAFAVLLMIGTVFAFSISFSPTSLIFNLREGETKCKTISFGAPGATGVFSEQKWSPMKDGSTPWKLSSFTESSVEGLDYTLANTLDVQLSKGKTELCITANEQGYYKGITYISPIGQSGNQKGRMAIWTKVIVVE